MRQFLLKTVIIVIAVYILFQFTLGYRIDGVTTKIKSISSQHQRIEFKEKILSEMKKGTEKDNIFSEEERLILSNFINKILLELDLKRNSK
jgi:hypothetical protein